MAYVVAYYPDFAEVTDTLAAGETRTITVPLTPPVGGIGSIKIAGATISVQAIEAYNGGQPKGRFYPSAQEAASDYTVSVNISDIDELRVTVQNTDTVNSASVTCLVKYVRREVV